MCAELYPGEAVRAIAFTKGDLSKAVFSATIQVGPDALVRAASFARIVHALLRMITALSK
jgi:hypothetical protein